MEAIQHSSNITNIPAFDEVRLLFEEAVQDGVFPGASVLVATSSRILFWDSFGTKTPIAKSNDIPTQSMKRDTVFDVATLTASLVTTTLMMKLCQSGQLRLNDKVCRYLQGFALLGKSKITLAQILSHSSGLSSWIPFYEELSRAHAGARRGILTSQGARDYILNTINRSELRYSPGSRQAYSDLGYVLLGFIIEVLTGLTLDKAAFRLVFQPLGMKSSSYIDLSKIKRRGIHPVTDLIAPTEDCPWRKRTLCGEVHDENAWSMGGIAGHSGLFTTAFDIHLLAHELLSSYRGESSYLKPETVPTFWEEPLDFPDGWHLGWDSPGRENGMSESGLSQKAIGHNGFTGCSIWLEPEEGLEIILLSNRIHPSRSNKKIQAFRPLAHRTILQAVRKA